jgi:hypothetical protein
MSPTFINTRLLVIANSELLALIQGFEALVFMASRGPSNGQREMVAGF